MHTLLFMISIVRTILVLQLWWQHKYYFAKMTPTGTVPMTCSQIWGQPSRSLTEIAMVSSALRSLNGLEECEWLFIPFSFHLYRGVQQGKETMKDYLSIFLCRCPRYWAQTCGAKKLRSWWIKLTWWAWKKTILLELAGVFLLFLCSLSLSFH